MALQPIGSIDLQIAELEAKGIEREPGQLRELGKSIGGSIQGALKGAEILQKQAIDEQMDKEAKKLLMSGVDGINKYSSELGFDDQTAQMFNQMAQNIQDPQSFSKIYQMQKAKADKDLASQRRMELINSTSDDMRKMEESFDPKLAAKVQNRINTLIGQTTDDKTIKQLETMRKGVSDYIERSGAGTGTKKLADALKLTREEAAFFDKRISEAKIIKDKAAGVRVAVSRAMDNAASGKDPNNSTLDQVLGVTLQKVLDPPSVVRESEFARLGMTQSFLDMIQGKLKGLSAGGVGLTDTSRAVATQFIEDMNEIAERAIRKQMMTSAVRSGFGERFDLQEIDAQLFSPEEVAKMKDIHEGRSSADDDALDERIRKNVKLFLDNPDMLSGGSKKNTRDQTAKQKAESRLNSSEKKTKKKRRVATSIEEF